MNRCSQFTPTAWVIPVLFCVALLADEPVRAQVRSVDVVAASKASVDLIGVDAQTFSAVPDADAPDLPGGPESFSRELLQGRRSAVLTPSDGGTFERLVVRPYTVTLSGADVYLEAVGIEPLVFPHLELWRSLDSSATDASAHLSFDSRSRRWFLSAAVQVQGGTVLAVAFSASENPRSLWLVSRLGEDSYASDVLPPVMSFGSGNAMVLAEGKAGVVYAGTLTLSEDRKLAARAVTSQYGPIPSALNPATGSGRSAVLTGSFFDGDGENTITQALILVNSVLDGRNACFLTLNGNQIGLYNDASTAVSYVTPGGSGSVANSQCTLFASGSSVTQASGLVKMTVSLQFAFSFGGAKSVYMYVADDSGLNSGWQVKGSWTAPTINSPPRADLNTVNVQDNMLSLSWSASDPEGASDISTSSLLINNSLNGAAACYVVVNVTTNQIGLVNDSGSGTTFGTPNSGGVISNSQCTLLLTYSYFTNIGTSIRFMTAVQFKPGFTATRNAYVQSVDRSGASSGWVLSGQVPGSPVLDPTPVASVSVNGSFGSMYISASFTEPDRSLSLQSGAVLINDRLSGVSACYVIFDGSSNRLGLVSDSGNSTTWLQAQGSSAENSQCLIQNVNFSKSGNLSFSFNVSFKFRGTKSIYAIASNSAGQSSGWLTKGSVVLPSVTNSPPVVAMTLASSNSPDQSFSITGTDENGPGDIQTLSLLISDKLDGRNACYVVWQRSTNQIGLVSDSGTSTIWINQAAVENSQCILQSGSLYSSADQINLSVRIRFKRAFGGSRSLYLNASDAAGATPGWQLRSTLALPSGNIPPVPVSAYYSYQPTGATLNASFSSTFGSEAIVWAGILINSSIDGRNACFVVYDAISGKLGLVADSGASTSWVTPLSNQVVSNSQCSLNALYSSVNPYGNALGISADVRFKASFSTRSNSLYASAVDDTSTSSGWQYFTAVSATPSATAPLNATVQLVQNSNGSYTLSTSIPVTFPSDIGSVSVLVNSTLNGAGACYLIYNAASNQISLIQDSGTGSTSAQPGAAGQLSNSQCTIDNSQSRFFADSYSSYALQLVVSFAPAFAGTKTIYYQTVASSGVNSGWVSGASVTVTAANVPPVPRGLSPYSISPNFYGPTGTLYAIFGDANGASTISNAQVLINSTLDGRSACFVVFRNDQVGLVDDSGTATSYFSAGVSLLQNSQCSITMGSILKSGTDLQIQISFTFKNAFAGAKYIYLNASDNGGLTSGWQIKGTWSIPLPYGE